MREICQSGSMSGNRKQDQANRTEGTRRKQSHIPTGRLQSLRLFSTLLAISLVIRYEKLNGQETAGGSGITCSLGGKLQVKDCLSDGAPYLRMNSVAGNCRPIVRRSSRCRGRPPPPPRWLNALLRCGPRQHRRNLAW